MMNRKLPQCFSCRYHSGSLYLVCAVHPTGPQSEHCSDFDAISGITAVEPWAPIGWTFEAGELVRQDATFLVQYDDSHPMVTGRCPRCGHGFDLGNPPAVHWDCEECGWMDDSV